MYSDDGRDAVCLDDNEQLPNHASRRLPAGAEVDESKQRKPRPKLTYETLTHKTGIPEIFSSFRPLFKKQRRRGRNVAVDLGRLLDMYENWQRQVFSHCDFDAFLSRVQRLYGKPGGRGEKGATLKGDMRELREKVAELALERFTVQQLSSASALAEDMQAESNSCSSDVAQHDTSAAGPQGLSPSIQYAEPSPAQGVNSDDEYNDFLDMQRQVVDTAECWAAEDDVLDDLMCS